MHIPSLKEWLSCGRIDASELYLVGGTVRDLLLGNQPKDLDLVCKGAKEAARSIAHCRDAALVHMEKKPGEPCYRVVDRRESDKYLDIAEMRGSTIEDDLGNRDFTVDAIAMRLREDMTEGSTIDPFDGIRDIHGKIIRTVSDRSIISDPLRILRAVRLSATLGFDIEGQTRNEMKSRAVMLKEVSSERVMAELLLILQTLHSSRYFRFMDELGILEIIFPEIVAMKGCAQNGFHHADAWEHSFLVMEQTEQIINRLAEYFGTWSLDIQQSLERNNRIPFLKLVALLHDIGKPSTKETAPDTGKTTFWGHEKAGAEMIGSIAGRLKTSGRNRDFMVLLTTEHLQVLRVVSGNADTAARTRWYRKMGDDSAAAIILGMADVMASRGRDSSDGYRARFMRQAQQHLANYYEQLKKKFESPNLVSGKDLIVLGLEPGSEMGIILERIRTAQDTGEISSREEALALAKNLMIRQQD